MYLRVGSCADILMQLHCPQVFRSAYCKPFRKQDLEVKDVCSEFVTSVHMYKPELLRKPKFHLLLHLPEDMKDFGPTAAFNAERYNILLQ